MLHNNNNLVLGSPSDNSPTIVRNAKTSGNNRYSAVKIISNDKYGIILPYRYIFLLMLDHPYLQHGYDKQVKDNIHFILVDNKSISMLAWLNENDSNVNKDYNTNNWLVKIIVAINAIHVNGYIYNNFNLNHVLVNNDDCVITNFSKVMHKNWANSIHNQVHQYSAPEQLQQLNYDQRIDLWSLGCFIFRVITGFDLFNVNKNNIHANLKQGIFDWAKITNQECPWSINENCPDYKFPNIMGINGRGVDWTNKWLILIREHLLIINPEKRKMCSELLDSPFIVDLINYHQINTTTQIIKTGVDFKIARVNKELVNKTPFYISSLNFWLKNYSFKIDNEHIENILIKIYHYSQCLKNCTKQEKICLAYWLTNKMTHQSFINDMPIETTRLIALEKELFDHNSYELFI